MKDIPFSIVRGAKMGLADQLTDGLRQAIRTGYYREGDVLPTREALIRAFGVSERVPRMAFARLAAEGLVTPRPGIGCQVLGSREKVWNGHVLLAVSEDGSSYYAAFSSAMRRRLMERGWLLTRISFGTSGRSHLDASELDVALSRAYSLAVLMVTTPECGRFESRFERSGVPYIAFNFDDRPRSRRVGSIVESVDEAIAGFAAHCQAAGVRSVLQVGCGRSGTVDIVEPLRRAGLRVEEIVCPANASRMSFEVFQRMGVNALYEWLEAHSGKLPDLVFFSDDLLAGAAFPALLEAGLRIPEDVRVVTFANRGFGPVWRKPFTRIEADARADGEAVADAALAALAGGTSDPAAILHRRYVTGETFPAVGRRG